MAYTPEYTSSDASTLIIDFGVTIAVALVAFASIIGLVLLYKWFKKNKR